MLTAKGNNYESLLNVVAVNGTLTVTATVPMTMDIDKAWLDKAIPWIKDKITTETKPHATLLKCIEQIEHYKQHLTQAYIKLHETYTYHTTEQKRQSPIDKARYEMLSSIPDNKMLRAMCALHLGDEKASNYVLPDEKEDLINATVQAMRSASNGNDSGKE